MTTPVPQPRRTLFYVGPFEFPDRNAAAQRATANALILEQIGYRVVLIGLSRDLPARAAATRVSYAGVACECWEIPYPVSISQWVRRLFGIGDILGVIEATLGGDDLAAILCYEYPAIAQERLRAFVHKRGGLALAEAVEWPRVSRLRSLSAVARSIDRPLRMRWVNRRMDGLFVASAFLGELYGRFGVPTVVLPTLMSDDAAADGVDAATPDSEPKHLVFAGTGFDPRVVAESREGLKDRLDKVIAALHAAYGLGADFKLDVFGAERDDYLRIVPAQASLLAELGSRVVFHGRQPRSVVRARLAKADFSIFLRQKTPVTLAGFPTKYAESIHFGTPVITNAVGSIVSYHVEGLTGHYIEFDDESIAGCQIKSILGEGAAKVTVMKSHCRSSRMFHYSLFTPSVKAFMSSFEQGHGHAL